MSTIATDVADVSGSNEEKKKKKKKKEKSRPSIEPNHLIDRDEGEKRKEKKQKRKKETKKNLLAVFEYVAKRRRRTPGFKRTFMTVRTCSHRLSMQSDVLNDSQSISNEIDCSASALPTTLIYSGLKLHPKPLVPTISMPSMANPLSIVKKLSLSDIHAENTNKAIASSLRHPSTTATTPSSIRLVTSGTGFSTSKTYIFNPQQHSSSPSSSSLVTLIPPGTSSTKLQTLMSSSPDLSSVGEHHHPTKTTTTSFLTKNRLTLVQPLISTPGAGSSSPSSSSSPPSAPPKLMIQQNSTSNLWTPQSTTKILSAKMLSHSHPVQWISSSDHSTLSSPTTNDNPIFTTKTLDSGHQAFIHMSLLPSSSTTTTTTGDSINPVQLTNFYSTPSSVRLATARSMDHNNNLHHNNNHHHHHSITTPIVREMQLEEKSNESAVIKTIHQNKPSPKNRARLPLQPTTQQISSILPSAGKKHKLPDDEPPLTSEPPTKLRHYEPLDSSSSSSTKKIRKSRHRPLPKISIENATPTVPSTSSIGVDTSGMIPSKKRSSAELAAAAILSSSHLRKKRTIKKSVDESNVPIDLRQHDDDEDDDPSIVTINDELLKRLSQDFAYLDQRTGLRWIARKTRSQPMSTLLSRFSWKPKINHYEKYSDAIRINSKRTVPVRTPETTRQKLVQPWASWRIDRLTNYLNDLTHEEHATKKDLTDIGQLFDQLNIDDQSFRHTIENLIEDNLQRHRAFSEQLTQISSLMVHLLGHGHTLKEISSTSSSAKLSVPVPSSKKGKER